MVAIIQSLVCLISYTCQGYIYQQHVCIVLCVQMCMLYAVFIGYLYQGMGMGVCVLTCPVLMYPTSVLAIDGRHLVMLCSSCIGYYHILSTACTDVRYPAILALYCELVNSFLFYYQVGPFV